MFAIKEISLIVFLGMWVLCNKISRKISIKRVTVIKIQCMCYDSINLPVENIMLLVTRCECYFISVQRIGMTWDLLSGV